MNFADYQAQAAGFAVYESPEYPLLGLAEETGEFIGIFAKASRGDDLYARFGGTEGLNRALLREAGDILWQLSQCLTAQGLSLADAAALNLEKLADRRARGVLSGTGDTR